MEIGDDEVLNAMVVMIGSVVEQLEYYSRERLARGACTAQTEDERSV